MVLDRLTAGLSLTIGSVEVAIAAGDLKRFELDLAPWGFEGRAEWYVVSSGSVDEDSLFDAFLGEDPVTIALTLRRTYDEVEEEAAEVTLRGLVIERDVVERAQAEIRGAPVLTRRYRARFQDRGQALWRRHRPTELHVDASLADVLGANTPSGVTVTCDWSAASSARSIFALGLGEDRSGASFYDFLFWLLHEENAALLYDIAGDAYSIVGAKPEEGDAEALRRARVASLEVELPAPRRDAVNVLNAYTDAAVRTKAVTNADAVQGVRTDYLIRSAVEATIDTRATLEAARAAQRAPELRIALASYPAVPLLPSMLVELDASWGESAYGRGETYRVVATRISAAAVSQEAADDNGAESNRYEIDYTLRLELASDPVFRHPPFQRPSWPFHVEGKVVSETGEATDATYQAYTDEDTSIDFYQVEIPLWGVTASLPFAPGALSGHFYFPLSKGDRVLVALGFDEAAIVACLDWRSGARLPGDTQGNHLLVGESATSATSIQHVYTEGMPVLTVQRTSGDDVQTITVSEGTVIFEVK